VNAESDQTAPLEATSVQELHVLHYTLSYDKKGFGEKNLNLNYLSLLLFSLKYLFLNKLHVYTWQSLV